MVTLQVDSHAAGVLCVLQALVVALLAGSVPTWGAIASDCSWNRAAVGGSAERVKRTKTRSRFNRLANFNLGRYRRWGVTVWVEQAGLQKRVNNEVRLVWASRGGWPGQRPA